MNTEYIDFLSFDHRLSIKKISSGKEPNILLLHGFNDNKETFTFIEEYLSSKFTVFSFDFRGHGDSDWKKEGIYHYSEMYLDVHNVVSKFITKPFIIMGHSMGASVAARYAGLFPDSILSLICLEGFMGIQPLINERKRIIDWLSSFSRIPSRESLPKIKKFKTIEEAAERLKVIFYQISKERLLKLTSDLLKFEDGKYIWKSDIMLKYSNPFSVPPNISRELWKNITAPVLICMGNKSKLLPENLEEILSHFSNVQYKQIEDCGHNIQHEKPEELIIILEEFLRGII